MDFPFLSRHFKVLMQWMLSDYLSAYQTGRANFICSTVQLIDRLTALKRKYFSSNFIQLLNFTEKAFSNKNNIYLFPSQKWAIDFKRFSFAQFSL